MKFIQIILLGSILFWASACNPPKDDSDKEETEQGQNQKDDSEIAEAEPAKTPTDFVPEGFDVFDKVFGDLNKDGLEDCVLIIKGTDESAVIEDEYLGKQDRNRRGIIVLFKDGNTYNLATKNDNCFSSENEDGGVYFPPELSVEIDKGNLYLHYSHGRYGNWKYTFRYQEEDFKLIGYDQNDHMGPVLQYSYSYNFLSGKKLTKENINFYSDNPDNEVLKETWEDLEKSDLISLSLVDDFDDLHFNE